ncbi:triose-phosphate isomerase [Pectinatus cerevisiiphilus]|uniref:Triosephosphate isomerase n=1 Tax=Pectinatus cerevisiiphilus TaxID=86956 RepID=A0A4R3K8J8_9FIRM|nr:triose-phosphate isomerase [Pectinatus cerevisiiphilus]TCS79326.1 triosephosphate isomerase [Pectinatus cerevisiiphilus]
MRKPIIAGNWKMNNTIAAGTQLIKDLAPLVKENNKVDIVVCPTYTALAAVAEAAKGTNVHVGAQNVHWAKNGAFTGEISTDMLKEIGVEYVIIGHSERREYFGETDEGVNKRSKAALAAGLTPIICCGETLKTREAGTTNSFVKGQIEAALNEMTTNDVAKVVIAYEPIWAIGTGKTATFEQAEEVCAVIRKTVAAKFDQATADKVRIQYGGSVKPNTIDGLMQKPNVDGALVGGASLKAPDFARIVNFN